MRRGSLADERPDLLSEWSSSNEISPSEVSCGSHKKVQWRCSKGHEWQATVKNRALIGSGCPYCSCRAVLNGFNDLASIHPELIEEWSDRNLPLSPTEVSEFSNKKVWWKCKEGHEWYALISSRSDGHGCPYCAGQLVYEGYNDLNTTNPQIAAEWSERNKPLLPNKITAKNTQNVWWCRSVCGNEYKAVISSRVKGRTCPFCNLIKQNEERIKRLIDVNHTLAYFDHKDGKGFYFSVGSPKTENGYRKVVMTQAVKAAFVMEKKYQELANLKSVDEIDGYDDFIFINRFGHVQHQGSLNKAIRRIIRDYNVASASKGNTDPDSMLPHFTCHVLRHTFATRMIESGASIKFVQESMGHSEIQTTMDIYVTVTDEYKHQEIKPFEDYMKSSFLLTSDLEEDDQLL